MAANPSVCAVCLTADRPEMAARAVRSFVAQSYPYKHLLIFDSGVQSFGGTEVCTGDDKNVSHASAPNFRGDTIGALRNAANTLVGVDIIIHWDDDDWSHPNRIAEQVALLQASGAEAVAYNEMLFLDERPMGSNFDPVRGRAWLYRNPSPSYAIGTSLCYWRETWKRKPFPDLPRIGTHGKATGASEDDEWIKGLKIEACSSVYLHPDPRMIASIHGGNVMAYNIERWYEAQRVPEYDEYCRKAMAL